MINTGNEYNDRLITFFCPWMSSEHGAGTYEYAVDVQDMLMSDGFVTQISKTDDGLWYVEPINE